MLPLGQAVRIGTAPGLELRLEEAVVDDRHAQLVLHDGTYRLMDLHSAGGTFVDGERAPAGQAVPVLAGSLIRFGEGGPLAVLDHLERLTPAPRELVIQREDRPAGPWSLRGGLQVGRGEHCGIQLDPAHDVLASTTHLHLMPAFGGAVATDLGSANGTWHEDGRRVVQRFVRPGEAVLLGGAGGPTLRLRGPAAPVAPAAPEPVTSPAIPECFWIDVSAGGEAGRIQVACKAEARFGSFAGLNDFETICFPRDLESDDDALERAEAIGPQHGTFALTPSGVALRDGGVAPTKLNGRWLPAGSEVPLPDVFELFLGQDNLGLRGRVLRHPRLDPTAPVVGVEGRHPVECLTVERMGDAPDSRLFVLLVRQATIGSAEEAAIHVPAPGVAPQHAVLYLRAGALWVSQLGAAPVAVDGVPLSPGTTVPLSVGSSFYVGAAVFRISEP